MKITNSLGGFLLVVLTLFCESAIADQLSKTAKIKALADELGYGELLANGMPSNDQQIEQVKRQVLDLMASQLESVDPEFANLFEVEFLQFVSAINPPNKTEQLMASFVDEYGARLTEAELDQVLAFVKSPVGRKSVSVEKEVTQLLLEQMGKEDQARFKKALTVFTARIQQLIVERKSKRREAQYVK